MLTPLSLISRPSKADTSLKKSGSQTVLASETIDEIISPTGPLYREQLVANQLLTHWTSDENASVTEEQMLWWMENRQNLALPADFVLDIQTWACFLSSVQRGLAHKCVNIPDGEFNFYTTRTLIDENGAGFRRTVIHMRPKNWHDHLPLPVQAQNCSRIIVVHLAHRWSSDEDIPVKFAALPHRLENARALFMDSFPATENLSERQYLVPYDLPNANISSIADLQADVNNKPLIRRTNNESKGDTCVKTLKKQFHGLQASRLADFLENVIAEVAEGGNPFILILQGSGRFVALPPGQLAAVFESAGCPSNNCAFGFVNHAWDSYLQFSASYEGLFDRIFYVSLDDAKNLGPAETPATVKAKLSGSSVRDELAAVYEAYNKYRAINALKSFKFAKRTAGLRDVPRIPSVEFVKLERADQMNRDESKPLVPVQPQAGGSGSSSKKSSKKGKSKKELKVKSESEDDIIVLTSDPSADREGKVQVSVPKVESDDDALERPLRKKKMAAGTKAAIKKNLKRKRVLDDDSDDADNQD